MASHPNEGGRRLREALEAEGLSHNRLRLERPGAELPRSLIGKWILGCQKPDTQNRLWLEERFGIPIRAWDEQPSSGPTVAA